MRLGDEDTALIIEFLKKQSKDPEGKLAQAQNSKPQSQEIGLHHSETPERLFREILLLEIQWRQRRKINV